MLFKLMKLMKLAGWAGCTSGQRAPGPGILSKKKPNRENSKEIIEFPRYSTHKDLTGYCDINGSDFLRGLGIST